MGTAQVKQAVPAVAVRPLPASIRVAGQLDRKCESCGPEDEPEMIQRSAEASTRSPPAEAGYQFSQLPILPAAPPAETLAVSEPDDASEREADRVAEHVGAALASDAPPPAAPPALSRHPVEQLHRAVAEQEPAPPEASSLLVDDEAVTLLPGQMRKTEFLAALRPPLCDAANRELAAVGRDSEGCPYLEQMFSYYAERDARHVERAVRKYVPAAVRAKSATDYVPLLSARVAQGVRQWVATGAMPDLPEGVTPEMLAGGGLMSALGSLGASIGGAVSALGGLFFKAAPGGARRGVDRSSLQARLDTGHPLAPDAQSRMGAAFGHDFSKVRIHADGRAAETARDLNAHAFTIGTHVAFASGQYHPGDPAGDALLAHELAHVVQQGGASQVAARSASPGAAEGAYERDADAAAEDAVVSLWARGAAERRVRPRMRSGLRLQRCSSGTDAAKTADAKPPEQAAAPKVPEAAAPQPQGSEAAAPQQAPPAEKLDWEAILPEAGAEKPGKRVEGVTVAKGPLTEFKWVSSQADRKGQPDFHYRTDVGALDKESDDPKVIAAAKQVEEARKAIGKRTFVPINTQTKAGPMAGYERSERVRTDIEASGSKEEIAADKSYRDWLKTQNASGSARAFGSFEGDPTSMQGSDKANLTIGQGLAASGGKFQTVLKEIMDKSPAAKQAFHDAGISLIERTEVQRGKLAMVVVDTEKKWKLVGADAELYIRARTDLLGLFVNIAQGYAGSLTEPPSEDLRKIVLDAETHALPRAPEKWDHPEAQLLAMRAVHSGMSWSAFKKTMTKAEVEAVIIPVLGADFVSQLSTSVQGKAP